MKNNGAKIAIAYRTLPGDSSSALVIGTNILGDSYHDALMNLVQDISAQQANELADILSVRKFPDGNNMLSWLHANGHLKKVPTNMVVMTPSTQSSIPLDELNQLIAQQKGVTVDELAVTDGSNPNPKSAKKPAEVKTEPAIVVEELTPIEMRSRADALFKEAQQLRKSADLLDPPKSKAKKVSVESE